MTYLLTVFTLESMPYQLVKGQQTRSLLSEVMDPTIGLVTKLEEGQSSQIQVHSIAMLKKSFNSTVHDC